MTVDASPLDTEPRPSPPDGRQLRVRGSIAGGSSRYGLAILAVALVVVFQSQTGNFVTYSNFVAILVNTSSILLASIAVARLLIGGAIDLSLGGVYALAAVGSSIVARDTQSSALAVTAAILIGTLLGLINGLLVRALHISPIIVTLGLLAVYRGLALVATDARSVTGLSDSFVAVGRSQILGVPIPVVIAVAAFAIGSFVLTKTVAGLRTYAIGGSRDAARLCGIDVETHRLSLFVHVGIAVGLVGALSAARLGSGAPTIGAQFEIDVLTAVILGGVAFGGGRGRPVGVLIGVVTIGILNAGMIFLGIPDFYQQIAKGAVLLLALASDQLLAVRKRTPRASRSRPVQPRRERPPESERSRDHEQRDMILEATDLSKTYGPVDAVVDVSLSVEAGNILCVVGDNGAGKSTLIRMLTGVERPDGGTVQIGGETVSFDEPAQARAVGIEAVHQDLALCPNLSAADNLALGREPVRRIPGPIGVYDRRAAVADAAARFSRLGTNLDDYTRPVADLSGGQRQAVAISRVIQEGARVVILDEPTAALGVSQTANVLRLIRVLAESGVAVILISHDVEDVLRVADQLLVLNLGRVVYAGDATSVSQASLVQLMAGLSPDSTV